MLLALILKLHNAYNYYLLLPTSHKYSDFSRFLLTTRWREREMRCRLLFRNLAQYKA